MCLTWQLLASGVRPSATLSSITHIEMGRRAGSGGDTLPSGSSSVLQPKSIVCLRTGRFTILPALTSLFCIRPEEMSLAGYLPTPLCQANYSRSPFRFPPLSLPTPIAGPACAAPVQTVVEKCRTVREQSTRTVYANSLAMVSRCPFSQPTNLLIKFPLK